MPATATDFVSDLQRQLAEFAKRVDEHFPENTTVKTGADGLPVLLKYSARVIPESAQRPKRTGFGIHRSSIAGLRGRNEQPSRL